MNVIDPDRSAALIDLDHVRRQFPEDAGATDEELLARLLDPANPAPANPNALFDCTWYAERARIAGANPILHYLNAPDPLSPHPLIDNACYRERLWAERQEIAARPLEHFLADEDDLPIDPSPYFWGEAYAAAAGSPTGGLRGYLERGSADESPHPMIDMAAFRSHFGTVDGALPEPAITFATGHHAIPMEITPAFDAEF